jgi:predicted SnoaL-like aldol condensation-catalyzing enzyme
MGGVFWRPGVRSVLAAVLTTALLVTGVLVAIDLALLIEPGSFIAASESADLAPSDDLRLVHAFYDAANAFLSGENAMALTAVVSPQVRTHVGTAAPAGGPAALAAHFASLQRQGDLRLRVVRLVADDGELTTMVEAYPATQLEPVNANEQVPPLWRTIDRLRIEGGMIAEYWPGAVESRPLPPLPRFTVSIFPEETTISLARLEVGPGAVLRPLDVPFPQLVLVENGTLVISRQLALSVARASESTFTWRPAASSPEELLLGPGDAVLVPADTGQAIANRADEPASLISMLVAPHAALFGPKHNFTTDELTAVAMHDPARVGRRTAWASGVTTETLAVGDLPTITATTGLLELVGKQITLDPGERTPPATFPGLTFGIVSSGILHVAITPTTDGGAATAVASPEAQDPGSRLLRAGDAASVAPGAIVSMENVGATRLDLMLIEANRAAGVATPAYG